VTRTRGDEAGTALVEFTYLAVLLMVPLLYVVLSVFDVQRAAFGVTEAARQAGRTWVTSGCDAVRTRAAADLALHDQGLSDPSTVDVDGCPAAGGTAVVRVGHVVRLRGLGALLPADRAGLHVTGTFSAVRDRYAP
jgi:Flp pilus assembly protein TadG